MLTYEDINSVQGVESLTVGERLKLLFTELSTGINKFNANHFNKSIHTVDAKNLYQTLKFRNNYFDVSFKHIQSPVFFNPSKISFKEYVEMLCSLVPMIKLVQTQADDVYRGLKLVAAKGQVPRTMRNGDLVVMLNELKEKIKLRTENKGVYTRPVSDFYPNWITMDNIFQHYNRQLSTLKSRDMEVVSDSVNNVVKIIQILKRKVDSSDVALNDNDREYINETIAMLNENIQFIGVTMSMLSELCAVLQNHVVQLEELK